MADDDLTFDLPEATDLAQRMGQVARVVSLLLPHDVRFVLIAVPKDGGHAVASGSIKPPDMIPLLEEFIALVRQSGVKPFVVSKH